MFTAENTEGYSKTSLKLMNAELGEALKGFECGTQEYYDEEKRVSEEILKKWDAEYRAVVEFFFSKE